VLLVAALVGAIARRLGLPAIVAYLLVGLGVAAGAISSGVFSAALAAAVLSITLSAIAVRLFPTPA
jgi:Kef-type K+ transport system membrane component KefB